MKRPDQDRLLREILADDNLEHLRETSLSSGLAALRTRHRRRVLLSSVAASTTAAAVFAVLSAYRSGKNSPDAVAPASKPGAIQVIDDRQLLALFSDRPVALISAPGKQQLLFLDELADTLVRAKTR